MQKQSFLPIAWRTTRRLPLDVLRFVSLGFRSRSRLAAENLFLRKQLALYAERGVRSRRADHATRITLVVLARLIDWRAALTIVKPDTLIRWHRKGFRLFWRWKSKSCGRPPLPVEVQRLIATMARANVTWGEERIAAKLRLTLGITVSPRTVRRYMPTTGRPRDRASSQRWSTFVRNHAHATLACDFFVTITATFRTLYVFVVLDVGTRRIVHWNVTEHPTAAWTVRQFRAIVPGDQPQRFLIHDRDSIYAAAVDGAVTAMGLTVLKTPVRCPQTNHERPHASLGPGIPGARPEKLTRPSGHHIVAGHRVTAAPILAGLHHEYRLEPLAA